MITDAAGTTTPLATSQHVTLTTPHENSIILNSVGKPPAPIHLSANSYTFVLTTSADVTIDTADHISALHAGVTGVSNTADLTCQVDSDDHSSNNKFTFLDGDSTEKARIDENGDFQIDDDITIGDASARRTATANTKLIITEIRC